jgi:hypothetical protein
LVQDLDCSDDEDLFCKLSAVNTLCRFCGVNIHSCEQVCDRGLTKVRPRIGIRCYKNKAMSNLFIVVFEQISANK